MLARLRRANPCLVLLLFTVVLLWPLCRGRALYWGDILFYFEPMAAFAKSHLGQGRLPLWNPYVLCGQPFLGNPQMGIFYPTTFLGGYLPTWLSLSLNTLLHVFLCGAFCFLYLRRWTVHRTSALAGALVYMGSSCLIGRLQFPPMIQTAPYLPLLLYWLDRNIDRPRPEFRLGITVTVALTVLAAHAQMAYMTVLCASAYGLMRLWSQAERLHPDKKERRRHLRTQIAAMLGAGVLGVFLTAIQTLPALQLMKASTREALTPTLANRFVLQPQQLLTLFDPHFFGHPATADYWGGGNAWEPAIFVGWLPLLLAGYAVVRCSKERWVRFWAILGLFGIWLALGIQGGLYWLAFYAVPGVSSFHDPARFLFFTTIAFALLSAVGIDALRERIAWCNRRFCRWALLGIALPLIWYGQEWNPTTTVDALEAGIRSETVAFGAAKTERLYLPEHSLYWRRFVTDGYSDYGANDPQTIQALRQTLIPNLPMGQGIAMAAGYEPVPISAVAGIDGLTRTAFRRGEPNLDSLLSMMQVGILALPTYQHTFDPDLAQLSRRSLIGLPALPGRVAQFQAVGVPPAKVWMVRTTRHIEGKMRVSAVLTSPGFDPRREAVVTGAGAADQGGVGAGDPGSVRLVALSETDAQMEVDAGARPGYLVYTSTAYPGWSGRIDGKAVRPVRTNGAFLGLPVPAGKHKVAFVYRPTACRLGAFLSLIACSLLIALCVPSALSYWSAVRALRAGRSGQSRLEAEAQAYGQ